MKARYWLTPKADALLAVADAERYGREVAGMMADEAERQTMDPSPPASLCGRIHCTDGVFTTPSGSEHDCYECTRLGMVRP